jgi:hypothetical protein
VCECATDNCEGIFKNFFSCEVGQGVGSAKLNPHPPKNT